MKNFQMIAGIGAGAGGGWYRSGDGAALYRVQSGDTLGKLSAKYLGSGSRYMELFNFQDAAWKAKRKGNPNLIYTGETMAMPAEAVMVALNMGLIPGGAGGGSDPGPPVSPPSGPPAGPPGGGGGSGPPVIPKPPPAVAQAGGSGLLFGALALAGVGLYLARKKLARAFD